MEAFWQFTTIFVTKFSLSDWWLIVSYMLNETHPHSHSPVSSLLFSNFGGAGSICFLAKQRGAFMVHFSQSICVDHWIFLFSQSMVGDLPQTYRHTTLLSLIGRFCPHSVIIIFVSLCCLLSHYWWSRWLMMAAWCSEEKTYESLLPHKSVSLLTGL